MSDSSSSTKAATAQSKDDLPFSIGKATFAASVAGLAGLMFGLDTGVISGALKFLSEELHTSDRLNEWIVSSLMLGAAGGALSAAVVAERAGRRGAMFVAGIFFFIGTLLCALAPSAMVLIFGRVVLGIGVGLAAFAAPLYIAEVVAPDRRGQMISVYQLIVAVGMLLAFVSDSLLTPGGHWRWMLGVLIAPTCIFIVATLNIPDSPRWLVADGQKKHALHVLTSLRGSLSASRKEIDRIERQLRKEEAGGYELFKSNGGFRRSFSLGIALQALQQLTGINVLLYYAPHLLESMHFTTSASVWCTVIFGFINLVGTISAIFLIDRLGRRPLLITSTIVSTIGIFIFASVLRFDNGSFAVHVSEIILLGIFILGYAIGAGPVPWTLCAEIQPLRGRTAAIAASTFTNWMTNWLIANIFLSVISWVGNYGTFWILAGFNALFLLVAIFFVPETRGCSLEEIEDKLNKGLPLRKIGR